MVLTRQTQHPFRALPVTRSNAFSGLKRLAISCASLLCTSALASDPIFTDGFEPPCPGAPAGVTSGIGSALLVRGTVVTPGVAFVGEVLVQGDTIVCAAASCAGQAGAD